MGAAPDLRRNELAMIHIAKKDLGLDDETYRALLRAIARVESSKDLDSVGRKAVLEHFRAKGWKPRRRGPARPAGLACSDDQVRLIRHIWLCLRDAGELKDASEAALRRWVRRQSKRWDAPEFVPPRVADELIEALKKWAARLGVGWR